MMPRRWAQIGMVSLLALGGCAADPGAERPSVSFAPPPPYGTEPNGGSWEAVLPGPVVAGLTGSETPSDWITTRRDASLSPRQIEPLLATEAWPQPPRPTLERPRFVRIVRSPEGFIYYRPEQRHGWPPHHHHRRW